jgi:hypothetical protein
LPVVFFHRGGVDIETNGEQPLLGGNPAELTDVSPEVPDRLRPTLGEKFGHQALFVFTGLRRIVRVLVIFSPFGAARFPFLSLDRSG